MDKARAAVRTANEKNISADTSITSRKSGFEFLNDLFVKRHRNILWKSALRITYVCLFLCCGAVLLMMVQPGTKADINKMVMTWLPHFASIMYLINRDTGFTHALFMNCDHSLLTYFFYKRLEFVLRLFHIWLLEIIKVNAVPALVIGCGLALILYVSGGMDTPLNYVVLVVTILSMSAFFSIHYLTVYYLLQPYTAGTEMKRGIYRIVMILTYVVCRAMINVRMPILVFGRNVHCFLRDIFHCGQYPGLQVRAPDLPAAGVI